MSSYRHDRCASAAAAQIPSRSRFIPTLCALLLLVVATLPALAISRHVYLDEMTAGAGRVVYGRIAEVRNGAHPQYGHIAVTFVTIDVIEMIKGNAATRVTFMQFAGATGRQANNYHLPRYSAGEEVVLFLYPESQYGFTSPVGEGQGKFLVQPDARTGGRSLMNDRGNRRLFEPMRNEKAGSGLRLNAAERALIARESGAADLDTFRSLVRRLASGGSVGSSR